MISWTLIVVWGKSELMFYTVGGPIMGLSARNVDREVILVPMREDCLNAGWKTALIR